MYIHPGTPKGRSRANVPSNTPSVPVPTSIVPEDTPIPPALTSEPKAPEIKDPENPSATPVRGIKIIC